MTATASSPRVYVGTYAKYNNGSIAGAWLDLEDYSDRDEFLAACAELHKDESDPEFMFQGFEGFPRAFYCESEVSEELMAWVQLGEDDREMLARYQDALGDQAATLEDAQDHFSGTYADGADAAEQMAEDLGAVVPKDMPAWIVIDWDASWECNLRHDFATSTDADGRLWLFNH